jgi:hypothetical protein
MALLKWTYLNLDYYGPVLQEWRNNYCFEDFQRELGYRLVMKSALLKKEVTANGSFGLNMVLENVGFAPVYNKKNAFLILKSVGDETIYEKALEFDVRKVVPDAEYNLTETVNLSGIPAGDYSLYLKIEDASPSLNDRPEYSIQLANSSTWEAGTGMNELLHTLTIN